MAEIPGDLDAAFPMARMAPALLRKDKELAEAGATIVGSTRPTKAPGLADYPKCDEEVARLADELWGRGKVVTGKSPEQILKEMEVDPDFAAPPYVRWIHRTVGETEIYFVASNSPQAREVTCAFLAGGLRPEFWRPETGEIEPVAVYEQDGGLTRIPIVFEPSGSVFVVFRRAGGKLDPVVSVRLDGRVIAPPPERKGDVVIEKAVYGIPGDPERTRDVRSKLQAILDGGESALLVSRLAVGDDPAYGIVKTVEVEYTAGGKAFQESGKDPDILSFPVALEESCAELLEAE